MIGLSGLAVCAAVVPWVVVVGFWSQRYSVWSAAVFSIIALFLWRPAIDNGYAGAAIIVASVVCLAGIAAILLLMRRAKP